MDGIDRRASLFNYFFTSHRKSFPLFPLANTSGRRRRGLLNTKQPHGVRTTNDYQGVSSCGSRGKAVAMRPTTTRKGTK